uniref:Uncharacterized protein n=1 Tax=Tetranychus urticae TaxID=32264 RepID=T1JY20_TETUR
MENQRRSSVKLWLLGIYSFVIALNIVTFISAIFTYNVTGICLNILSIVIDGVLLTAIVKEWRVVLNIGRIVLTIVIVILAIAIVFDGIAIGNVAAVERNALITIEVILSVSLLCNGFLFVLFGKYTAELSSSSYA